MQKGLTFPEEKGIVTINWISWFFITFIVAGIVCLVFYSFSFASFATALMWMLACSISGVAIGFLFGIPKILQNPKDESGSAKKSSYQMQVNTNLTEISDWLTKIIVGLSLVHLTKVPPYLYSLASALANAIVLKHNASALGFAYGLITCYSVVGFLFGYLFTRLVLSKAFVEADHDTLMYDFAKKIDQTGMDIIRIQSNQNVLSQTMLKKPEAIDAQGEGEAAAEEKYFAALLNMANEYMKIKHSDWAERTRLKDAAADEMGAFALRYQIPKQRIQQTYLETKDEGLVLALATLISVNPEPEDAEILLSVAVPIKRLHVRYRVLMAIDSFYNKGLSLDKSKVKKTLQAYRVDADKPLLRKIENTESLMI